MNSKFQKVSTVALAAVMTSALGFAGCKDQPREVVIEAVHSQVAAKLDPALSSKERSRVVSTVADMLRADVQAEPNKGFARVFGGTSMTNVGAYLNERISFILSKSTDPYGSLYTGTFNGSSNVVTDLPEQIIESTGNQTSQTVVGASNSSIGLFYTAAIERMRGKALGFGFGGQIYPVTSTRIGVMQLDRGFTDLDVVPDLEGNPTRATWIERSSMLVHEARHSDCTGGVTREELLDIAAGRPPRNKRCGHHHDTCGPTLRTPDGNTMASPYAGVDACDSELYGSYGVELVYLAELATKCRSCSELQKQQALMSMVDRMMRFVDPMPTLLGHGTPDMGSVGLQ